MHERALSTVIAVLCQTFPRGIGGACVHFPGFRLRIPLERGLVMVPVFSIARPIFRCALLAAALLAAGCGKEAPPPPRSPPQVSVITIEPKSVPYALVFVAQ